MESNSDDEDDYAGPIAYLAAPDAEPGAQLAAEQIERLRERGLARALASLDERSRRIVEARWLVDDTATLHDLAAEFGVSAERIRQIEQKAMQRSRRRSPPRLPDWHRLSLAKRPAIAGLFTRWLRGSAQNHREKPRNYDHQYYCRHQLSILLSQKRQKIIQQKSTNPHQ
jgi:hypothetical protein